MLIYFVRHGQTEANKKRIFQTPTTPLSAEGEVQAGKLAERFKEIELDEIWVSPLLRAKQTAEIINQYHHVPVVEKDELKEIYQSTAFDGKPEEDVFSTPELGEVLRRQQTDPHFKYLDAETYIDVLARAEQLLNKLKTRATKEPADFTLCITTHGLILSTLLMLIIFGPETPPEILQKGIWNIWQENTSISFATLNDGRWKLMTIGDFAHL